MRQEVDLPEPTRTPTAAGWFAPTRASRSAASRSVSPHGDPAISPNTVNGAAAASRCNTCYKARCKTEANLDGKYLLRCSDPHLPAADIALGYQQLLQVERGWRDMKQILDLRPVYHRLEERIRAHVVLCWLALLLIRIIETRTGDTWPTLRRHLDRLHTGTFTGPTGTFRQRTELSKPQRDLLAALDIPAPKQIIELAPTPC